MKQIHIFTIFPTVEAFFDGQFKYLTDCGHEIVVVSSDNEKAAAFAERNGIRFIPVEMPRALKPMAIFKAIRQIVRIIKRENPVAVFGHTPVGALCAMIAAKWCGVRTRVYYRHGLIYTTMNGVKRFIFRREEKFVSSLATAVVNVSNSLSRLAVNDKLNPDRKQYVIGFGTCGGIDSQNVFNPELIDNAKKKALAEGLGVANADIVYGFCGRICTDKGVPEMVDAFLKFKKKHQDIKAKLLLIGNLDDRDILPPLTKDVIMNSKDIIVSGWVKKADIPYYYSLLDVFVFPSHREGFGMCVIEASAMQKPILVSRSHGCEDSIVEHITGEYIGLSADSICLGMEKVMDDNVRKRLGENGRRVVTERYDCRVMWPLVKTLYDKILK